MIRRKLTRIEVTLDDTKELDDLFIKPTQPGISAQAILPISGSGQTNTASNTVLETSTSSSSKLTNLKNIYHQKKLFLIGKDYSHLDSSLESPSASTGQTVSTKPIDSANINSADPTSTLLIQPTETISFTTTPTNNSNLNETQSSTNTISTSYNPQPYNPSNRFQLNPDNQQFR